MHSSHSKLNEISPVEVEVNVEVPWEHVEQHLDETYGRLQRSARVPGFRPGKVPRNVVKQIFGQRVQGEVVASIVEECLLKACQEHSLIPVAQPHVDAPELATGKPLHFTAKLEIRPRIDQIHTDALELTRKLHGVSDSDVEEELQRLREQNAEVVAPEPSRPAREGDILVIDYSVAIDGEAKADMAATDRSVELGEGRLLPEFEEGLKGKSPGEHAEVRVTFADDYSREDLRGKTAIFDVHVKELREKVLPDADDEFAKDCGDFDSLDALKASIRERLEEGAKRRSEGELREAAVDAFVAKNPIPVPPSLLAQQKRAMLAEFAAFLQMTGQGAPTSDDLEATLAERAERKVRAALLFGELARQKELRVGNDDVDAKLQEIATRTGKHLAKVRVEYQGEKREYLESQLLEDKIIAYLLSVATIREEASGSDVSTAPEASAAQETKQEPKKAPKKKSAKKPSKEANG